MSTCTGVVIGALNEKRLDFVTWPSVIGSVTPTAAFDTEPDMTLLATWSASVRS